MDTIKALVATLLAFALAVATNGAYRRSVLDTVRATVTPLLDAAEAVTPTVDALRAQAEAEAAQKERQRPVEPAPESGEDPVEPAIVLVPEPAEADELPKEAEA